MKKYLLYITILIPILAFTFTGNPPGWYQQTLPDIGGRQIQDITFLDSLTGFAVVSKNVNPDTSSILKTTNGGNNWQIVMTQSSRRFSKIKFINSLTGFISGGSGSGTAYLYKTTDGGSTWSTVTGATFGTSYWDDMSVLNEDTIYLVDDNSLVGGVFRTTNGGLNWEQQLNLGSQNPTHVYFYNKDTGFCAANTLYRTTNSGINWIQVPGGTGFGDMHFINSSTGWKCYGPIQKTTDGGLNWNTLPLPPKGGAIILSRINRMHVLNKDTIWGVGSVGIVNSVGRGLVYITTNGGSTWGYQDIDTSIHSGQYQHIQFINKNTGWAYWSGAGIHTVTGGSDTTTYLNIHQTTNEVPNEFKLYQNYPNPFNPTTSIKFKIKSSNFVKLSVFDVTGKEIATLVDEKLSPGEYDYSFYGHNLTSGTYFYRLTANGTIVDTKKMMLIK